MTENKNNNHLLLRYLGFGFQLIISLAAAVFAGNWLDKKFNFKTPLLVWILPLFTITAVIIKVIKDTSKK